jgi:hypothetical protein
VEFYSLKLIDTNTNYLEKKDLKDEIDEEVSHLKRPISKKGSPYFYIDPIEDESKFVITLNSIKNLER